MQKAASVLFACLTVMALPSILLYGLGSSWDSYSSQLTDVLWRFTPANFGESDSVCTSANTTSGMESVHLQCPENTVIGRIEARYGYNTGSCGCPDFQSPQDGKCPATRIRGTDSCQPDGGYCFYTPNRVMNWPDGSQFQSGACCARKLENGVPAFEELDVKVDSQCDALVASRMAEMQCLRKHSCSLPLARDALVVWAEDQDEGRGCYQTERDTGRNWASENAAEASRLFPTANTICGANWADRGGMAGCSTPTNTSSAPLRLVVTAKCYDFTVDLKGYLSMDKDKAATMIVVLDLLVAFAFVLAVFILRARQQEEAVDTEAATSADYTVMFRRLPPHSSLTHLETVLREHLEAYLSSAPSVYRTMPEGIKIVDINFGAWRSMQMTTRRQFRPTMFYPQAWTTTVSRSCASSTVALRTSFRGRSRRWRLVGSRGRG